WHQTVRTPFLGNGVSIAGAEEIRHGAQTLPAQGSGTRSRNQTLAPREALYDRRSAQVSGGSSKRSTRQSGSRSRCFAEARPVRQDASRVVRHSFSSARSRSQRAKRNRRAAEKVSLTSRYANPRR